MEKDIFVASCPICGRSLFKGSPESYIEGACPKCKHYLKIDFGKSGYRVMVGGDEAEVRREGIALREKCS